MESTYQLRKEALGNNPEVKILTLHFMLQKLCQVVELCLALPTQEVITHHLHHPVLQIKACVYRLYWAIQAGLLTPLIFAQHRLSPLAAFTSGAYFLHNGWQ